MKPHVQHSPGGLAALGVAAVLAVGCGPPGLDDNPWSNTGELTLAGDSTVDMAPGMRFELEVRYHDGNLEPLAGVVEFEIVGDAQGARLSQRAATTDSSGRAAVTIDATAARPGTFVVEATALDARPVEWSVRVADGALPLNPAGLYQVQSSFSAQAHEGAVGEAVGGVLDLTLDPGPTILDRAAYLGDITQAQADAAGPDLNSFLEGEAPAAMSALRFLGRDFSDASKAFGATSELRVSGIGADAAAEHALSSFTITFGGEERVVTLDELEAASLDPGRVSVTITGASRVSLAEHAVPMPYASLLHAALDRIMGSEPGQGTYELMDDLFAALDCYERGMDEWFSIEFDMDPIVAGNACRDAVNAAVEAVVQLDDLAGTDGELVISGEASLLDTNGDDAADELVDGVWQGSINQDGAAAATLSNGSSLFGGERVETTSD